MACEADGRRPGFLWIGAQTGIGVENYVQGKVVSRLRRQSTTGTMKSA